MKLRLYVLVLIVLVLTGCTDTVTHKPSSVDAVTERRIVESAEIPAWNIQGYIADTEGDFRKLIVWGMDKEELEGEEVTAVLAKADPNAMWVTTTDLPGATKLQIGDEVRVWISTVDASYPSSATATRIELALP